MRVNEGVKISPTIETEMRLVHDLGIKDHEYLLSARKYDIRNHWDIGFHICDKFITADVKGLRKGLPFERRMWWVEILSVNGTRGSLFGDQDLIIWEDIDDWVIVDRETLQIQTMLRMRGKMEDTKQHKSNPEPYLWHNRFGRADIVCLVPIDDVRNIAIAIVKKGEKDDSWRTKVCNR